MSVGVDGARHRLTLGLDSGLDLGEEDVMCALEKLPGQHLKQIFYLV